MPNPFLAFKKRSIDSRILKENEVHANKAMALGCALTAAIITLLWVCYMTNVFPIKDQNIALIVKIALPILLVFLIPPVVMIRTKQIYQPYFKHFVLLTYIIVIATLNVLLPKHAVIGWSIILVLACHYYNPRLSLFVFGVMSVLMLFSIYGAMFLGEWDANLMGGSDTGIVAGSSITTSSTQGRYEYLHNLFLNGDNRYLKAFIYYFLPREAALSLVFFITVQLTMRTESIMKQDSDFIRDREKIDSELYIASGIQVGVLPRNFPNTDEFELYGLMDPAKEVGGDFYDFYMNKSNELIISIGDVSGKGIPASLHMMGVKTLLKSVTKNVDKLEKVFEQVNSEICQFNPAELFVTAVSGRLNLDSGEVTFVNAGHNPILIKRDGKFAYIKLPTGFVLGGFETTRFKAKTFNLLPNDQIFLYTDGVTEATNKDGVLFGEERLLKLLNDNCELSPQELTAKVKEAIAEFVGDAPQFDDITILSVLYKGAKTIKKEIKVESLPENLEVVTEFVNNFLDHFSDNTRAKYQINVAIDELFSNIVKFAYNPEVGEAIVRIELRENPVSVAISFVDHGKPFNPLEIENPDLSLSAEEREAGGLGIYIVRQSMDEICYEYSNGQNILTIKKKL